MQENNSTGSRRRQPLTEDERMRRIQERRSQRIRQLRRRVAAGGILLSCLVLFTVFLSVSSNKKKASGGKSAAKETAQKNRDAAENDNSVTILSVGDNLIHTRIFEEAKQEDGSYDFTSCYENVGNLIKKADVAAVNQESPLAASVSEPSGYPLFNTPAEDAEALKNIGFDVLSLSNNHILDQGAAGVDATLKTTDGIGVLHDGVWTDEADAFPVISKKGIKIAVLGFTDILNQKVPAGADFTIGLMSEEKLVENQIENAKSKADLVVVLAHWGEENQAGITERQREMAEKMVDWGADIIFGSHPHVLQKLEVLTRSSDGAKCPVMYSLGNFFSGQKIREQLVSGALAVNVKKDADTGKIRPVSMRFTPLVTQYEGDREDPRVMEASDYTGALAEIHGIRQFDEPMTEKFIEETVAANIPKQYRNRTGSLEND